MTTTHTARVPRRPLDAEKLGYFRFGAFADGVLLTNDEGRWHHLSADDFRAWIAGGIEAGHAEYDNLAAKGFIREVLSLDEIASTVRARKRYIGIGPSRHVLHLGDATGARLGIDAAKDILDHAMLSTSAALEFTLAAPAGTYDADLLAFIVQYGVEKNRYEGKALTWILRTDLANLPEKADAWLVDKRFVVQVRFDGPAAAHDAQSEHAGTAPHATVAAAIARLHATAATKGKADWRVQALVTVGQGNVGDPAGVLAALTEAGIRRFRLQPLLHGEGAITPEAFGTFYASILDGLLAAVDAGTPLIEDLTGILTLRALRAEPGAEVDARSPTGSGLGQLVYDHHGHIFPSESALPLHAEGDELFLLGKAGVISYKDCMAHPTLRTLAVASILECLPGFADHWSTPFTGVDPVATYAGSGDLFPKLGLTPEITAQQAMLSSIFGRLVADAGNASTLGRLIP